MKQLGSPPSAIGRTGWALGALSCVALCCVALWVGACAPSSSSAEPATPEAVETPEETPVQEEVPDVNQCHTGTQVCALAEPLQPGSGCFCDKEDGTKEAGTAGS